MKSSRTTPWRSLSACLHQRKNSSETGRGSFELPLLEVLFADVVAEARLTAGDDEAEVEWASRLDPTSIQLLSAVLGTELVGEFRDGFEAKTAELRVASVGLEPVKTAEEPHGPEEAGTVAG